MRPQADRAVLLGTHIEQFLVCRSWGSARIRGVRAD
jgi:hypothetical protein